MGARCDDDHALEEIREEGDDLVRPKLAPHFHCRATVERACALAHRLFKRDRNMGSTDFLTEDGDAEKIIAELNQLARGGASRAGRNFASCNATLTEVSVQGPRLALPRHRRPRSPLAYAWRRSGSDRACAASRVLVEHRGCVAGGAQPLGCSARRGHAADRRSVHRG